MTIKTTMRRTAEVLREQGISGVRRKAVGKAFERWGERAEDLHLLPDDVADSRLTPRAWPGTGAETGRPLTIGWIFSGLAEGSGGHTTAFRMVEALEAAGHRCVLYVYDGVGGSAERYRGLVRSWWPNVKAEIRDYADGLSGCDGYVATAWQTAHVLACRGDMPGARLYLAQDYEPYFYPRGAAYEFAADSYRFGFTTITIGRMVADELRANHDVTATVAPFGCDTSAYRVDSPERRSGVVFYAKPGIARRGFELAVLGLRALHSARPDIPIHTFGIKPGSLPFPAEVHAHMRPADLNLLYNGCSAGLALSFTNISLIATELLAAGVVPVVNDHAGSRADLDNRYVEWVRPTPAALAEGIIAAHERHRSVGPRTVSESVRGVSWQPAADAFVRAVEDACGERGVR
ncbi:glycosyltransferase family 1 protein [Microbacterium sp. NPDC057650]|uniref:rhamnosyltransferase WsaF family glycosyltransferase n=1 Tax=unclassified Microbacterium TaxID=2609290 RepID=UPI0036707111